MTVWHMPSHCSHTMSPLPGVAMGAAGADVAIDSADVVLFTTDLRRLGSAMHIAKSARRKIGENIGIAVTAKVCAAKAGIFNWMSP
jgi:Zn2+/Cd2+-exporting ATPase